MCSECWLSVIQHRRWWMRQKQQKRSFSTFFMKATSCLEIFSLLIFRAATFGMILQQTQSQTEAQRSSSAGRAQRHPALMPRYLMPRSLARLSWRSMMLCRISSTSCLSSLSSIREIEKSGSRKGGGKAAAMDLALKPEVTWGVGVGGLFHSVV